MAINPSTDSTSSPQASSGPIGWQKILAVGLGLVILAGISYLVLWSKKDVGPVGIEPVVQNGTSTGAEIDVSEWKIYRNEKYGFEIKYPREWFVINENQDGIYVRNVKSVDEIKEDPPFGLFVFNVWCKDNENPSDLPIEEWVSKKFGELLEDGPIADTKGVISIDQAKAFKFTDVGAVPNSTHVYIPKESKICSIRYQTHDDVGREILSTFKFIEP